jgi:hypothetical protein
MEKLPEELRLLVVERVSLIEDRANLRLVSRAWRDSVDRSFIRNWVQQLLPGKPFAAGSYAGLYFVQYHVNGRSSFVHTFNLSLYLALYPCLDISSVTVLGSVRKRG